MHFQEKFTVVFFIVTLYSEFNNIRFGMVINGATFQPRVYYPMLHTFLIFIKSICVAIWRSGALILKRFIYNLGTLSRLFPFLVVLIVLQNIIVNSITVVKWVRSNPVTSIYTFTMKTSGNYTFNSKLT